MSPVFYRVLALLIAVGSGLFLRDPLPDVGPAQEVAFEAAEPGEFAANSNRRRASATRLDRASNTGETGFEWLLDTDDAQDGWELPPAPRLPTPRVLGLELLVDRYADAADDGQPASTSARGPPVEA